MNKYNHLVRNKNVCGGRVIVKSTRIEPRHIVGYGTFDEIISDFNLTVDEIVECYHYTMTEKVTEDDLKAIRNDWESVGDILKNVLSLS